MTETRKSSSLDEEYENNITLSYEYAEKSIKEVQDASNHINTQLGLLIGFNLTFIRFFINNLPNRIVNSDCLPCNSCWLLKILAYVFSVASIILCLVALYKTIEYSFIKLNVLVESCDRISNLELKLAILDTWDEKLGNFIKLALQKKTTFELLDHPFIIIRTNSYFR